MFEFKPDYEQTLKRMEAFWEGDLLDRPLVQFRLEKPDEECVPLPDMGERTITEFWLDAEFQAELALAQLSNLRFRGDTLPIAWANLGPDVFPAFYGCPLHFGDYGTSWSEPILHDWSRDGELRLDRENFYLKKLVEMTDALLEIGRGKFITGMSDWHSGGDCLAALRDPQNLALDLIERPAEVKAALERIEADYYAVYDFFYHKLRGAGMPITTWTPLLCEGRYYVPSNDFSIMVSKKMFDEFFLPGIRRECQFLDRSIYHLDGPGALRHLDSILAIKELDALQFVPGAGNEGFARWQGVYRKAQAAGKSIQVDCTLDELSLVMETLDPRGVYLMLQETLSEEVEAERLLAALEKWRPT